MGSDCPIPPFKHIHYISTECWKTDTGSVDTVGNVCYKSKCFNEFSNECIINLGYDS